MTQIRQRAVTEVSHYYEAARKGLYDLHRMLLSHVMKGRPFLDKWGLDGVNNREGLSPFRNDDIFILLFTRMGIILSSQFL